MTTLRMVLTKVVGWLVVGASASLWMGIAMADDRTLSDISSTIQSEMRRCRDISRSWKDNTLCLESAMERVDLMARSGMDRFDRDPVVRPRPRPRPQPVPDPVPMPVREMRMQCKTSYYVSDYWNREFFSPSFFVTPMNRDQKRREMMNQVIRECRNALADSIEHMCDQNATCFELGN